MMEAEVRKRKTDIERYCRVGFEDRRRGQEPQDVGNL